MRKFVVFLIIMILSLIVPVKSQAAELCPTRFNANAAFLRILDEGGNLENEYLISTEFQAFEFIDENVVDFQYKDNPARWEVAGVTINPSWTYRYNVYYYDENWRVLGQAWFGSHVDYPEVYFYFIMPEMEQNHPRCDYGSVDKSFIDNLLDLK